jgi:gliding motility-associated-like protein
MADFVPSPQPADLFRTDISFIDASSVDVVAWAWNFGQDGVPGTSDQEFPTVHFPDDAAGTYPVQLVVTNVHGCTDTIIRMVVIDGYYALYAPNAFTPDGDGVNDTWIPRIRDQDQRLYQVRVFDRWGEEVWASTDPGKGWDGRLDGELLKTGVFVWKLETREANTSVRHMYIGHVSLLK